MGSAAAAADGGRSKRTYSMLIYVDIFLVGGATGADRKRGLNVEKHSSVGRALIGLPPLYSALLLQAP